MSRIFFDGNLYFMRHGHCDGNTDKEMRQTEADHSLRLSPEIGVGQAIKAAAFLVDRLYQQYAEDPKRFGKIRLIHTPFYRGHETAFYVLQALAEKFDPDILSYEEDPLSFERKFGVFDGVKVENYEKVDPRAAADRAKHEKNHGVVYAIPPLGESCMDVVTRVKPNLESTLNGLNLEDVRHAIFVNHGLVKRAQIMSVMNYSPHWFEAEDKPGNCWIRHIQSDGSSRFIDNGYIHGDGAPLYDRMATQTLKPGAEKVYMLKPYRPNAIIPPGVSMVDPFAKRAP